MNDRLTQRGAVGPRPRPPSKADSPSVMRLRSGAPVIRRQVCINREFERFEQAKTGQTLGTCLKQVATRYPSAIALQLDHDQVTYQQLDRRSDDFAQHLLRLRGRRSEPVAVMMAHESTAPAVMLGIAKAGKFFVPLDPTYPIARNREILSDAQASVIFVDEVDNEAGNLLCGAHGRVVSCSDVPGGATVDHVVDVGPDDLVGLIYTSGSAGTPKGVMRTHRGLIHNAMRHTTLRHISHAGRIAQLFSYSFGAGLSNTFSTLLNGATLLPFDLRSRGLNGFADWLRSERVSQFHTVPTVFRRIASTLGEQVELPHLELVMLGGEPMFHTDLALFQDHFPDHCLFCVGMGTSETGHLTACLFDKQSEYDLDILPAGYPSEHCDVRIVDDRGNELPHGEVGEIQVRGEFISPGYWRRSDPVGKICAKTSDDIDVRIRRTGDRACMLEDGCVFHLGRTDDTVKVRGGRIELGDVEAALRKVEGVLEAAVVPFENDGEALLAGYVVKRTSADLDVTKIRQGLSETLPAFMTPTRIICVGELPTLPNGKVDRNALANLPDNSQQDNDLSEPSRYMLEAQLRDIWCDVLGLSSVSWTDEFYDLGGDSVRAVEMFWKVNVVCGASISPADFAESLTIQRLCEVILSNERQVLTRPIVPFQANGSQTPLFFHNGDIPTGGLYCRNLAHHLGENQPLYSLMAHGVFGDIVPKSVAEMAADCLHEVQRVQPHGPYRLGGFCYGGLVAFEMAQQLRKKGQTTEALLLVDTRIGPDHFPRWSGRAFMWRLTPANRINWFRQYRKARTLVARVSRKTRRMVLSPIAMRPSSRQQRQLPKHNAAAVLDDGTVHELTHLAVLKYRPLPYRGRVALFYSSRVEPTIEVASADWKRIAPDTEFHRTPGGHRSCVTTHVAALAERMRPYL